jgi:predicted MPP superfamily phosphohydrolase
VAALAEFGLYLLAFVGHFSIAVWLFNRLHARAMPRPFLKTLERILLLAAAGIVVAYAARWVMLAPVIWPQRLSDAAVFDPWLGYMVVSWLAAVLMVPLWLLPKLFGPPCPALAGCDATMVDVTERVGYPPVAGAEAHLFLRVPGNQLLKIAIERKTLRLARLPPGLNGLTIAHLSDLHMTGQITREFYDLVVDETNALSPDLVVITGDILEKEACLPWIETTLGRLKSRHGAYFILGNHEYRLPNVRLLRDALVHAGIEDLGSRSQRLRIGDEEVLLAGNEQPWFGRAPEVPEDPGVRFRILLSHTPDQLDWAKAHDFDLMLAGHNHGGQIRLPYLGALITPSRYGCRYAGGLYHEPPVLLHVSRGVGGIHPIRLNCAPEIALLTLQAVDHR